VPLHRNQSACILGWIEITSDCKGYILTVMYYCGDRRYTSAWSLCIIYLYLASAHASVCLYGRVADICKGNNVLVASDGDGFDQNDVVCCVHGSGHCCVHRGSLCLLFSFAS